MACDYWDSPDLKKTKNPFVMSFTGPRIFATHTYEFLHVGFSLKGRTQLKDFV